MICLCFIALGQAAASSSNDEKSSLIAQIAVPAEGALVRGDVPVYGLATGPNFRVFILDYGQGSDPHEWTVIKESQEPQNNLDGIQDVNFDLVKTVAGNLGMWVTGLSEYPYADYPVDLPMGEYTLRLRVFDHEDNVTTDRVTVQVGRVGLNCCASDIISPDGQARIEIPEHSMLEPAKVFSLVPLEVDPATFQSEPGVELVSPLYRFQPGGQAYTQEITLSLAAREERISSAENMQIGLFQPTTQSWSFLPTHHDPDTQQFKTSLVELPPSFTVFGLFTGKDFRISPVAQAEQGYDAGPESVINNTFEASLEQWRNKHGRFGARLDIVTEECEEGSCLRVRNLPGGGSFAAQAYAGDYDVQRYPYIAFDYKAPPEAKINLLVKVNQTWYDIEFLDDPKIYWEIDLQRIGKIEAALADNNWHSVSFNLSEMLKNYTQEKNVQEIVLADWESTGFKKLEFGHTPVGTTYFIDNFRISK